MTAPKLCINCQYCYHHGGLIDSEYGCNQPTVQAEANRGSTMYLVDGLKPTVLCCDQRKVGALCGPGGHLFRSKADVC